MYRCFDCKREMLWYSDYDLKEYFPKLDKEGVVSVCHCKKCDKIMFYIFIYDEEGNEKLDSILTEDSFLL